MQSGASTAASGTKNNYLREDKMPMRIELVLWRATVDEIPHIAFRAIYDDGANEEINYGNYASDKPSVIGKGTGVIVDTNATNNTDHALANNKAILFDTISGDSEEKRKYINDIVWRTNDVMRRSIEFKGVDGQKQLRKGKAEELGGNKIDAVYKNNEGFQNYIVGYNACLSFVKYVVGDASENVKNANSNIFLDYDKVKVAINESKNIVFDTIKNKVGT